MLVADNEFGAPWNDQFYEVDFIYKDTEYPDFDVMTLNGPKDYTMEELWEKAVNLYPHCKIINICVL